MQELVRGGHQLDLDAIGALLIHTGLDTSLKIVACRRRSVSETTRIHREPQGPGVRGLSARRRAGTQCIANWPTEAMRSEGTPARRQLAKDLRPQC
jgi:hypothetical protein